MNMKMNMNMNMYIYIYISIVCLEMFGYYTLRKLALDPRPSSKPQLPRPGQDLSRGLLADIALRLHKRGQSCNCLRLGLEAYLA